jgi:hypothetical protein
MEVRIRSANDLDSRLLADVPFRPEVIERIIPTLIFWGLVVGGDLVEEGRVSGQFVDDGEKAFFEVVVDSE